MNTSFTTNMSNHQGMWTPNQFVMPDNSYQPTYTRPNNSMVCPVKDCSCECCKNSQRGTPCVRQAITLKSDASSQTEGVDFLTQKPLDNRVYFKRGTFHHTLVQRKISDVISKYELTSKKNLLFGKAVIEVLTSFPGLKFSTENRDKVCQCVAKAIRWKKFSIKRKLKKQEVHNEVRTDVPVIADIVPEPRADSPQPASPVAGPSVPPTPPTVQSSQSDLDSDDDILLICLQKNQQDKATV
ncbi:unnamed protein product [Mytilus coruscus]|uniref:Uncharacterized protein n=1 Tax=Mytilus coruscus TaxID=42192 RepID=A0A6J8CBH2_MYTCO|nr:unnamed protein product [Mytilus coruscus]